MLMRHDVPYMKYNIGSKRTADALLTDSPHNETLIRYPVSIGRDRDHCAMLREAIAFMDRIESRHTRIVRISAIGCDK